MNELLGKTARQLRESLGMTQRAAAEVLGVSVVHLCNVENGKANPSLELIAKYQETWGVDLYVLTWCLHGKTERLPAAVRKHADALTAAWKKQLKLKTPGREATP